MNIIVSGTTSLAEYKAKRAAMKKLAEDYIKQYNHGTPDGVYFKNGVMEILYTNGDKWLYTSTGKTIKEESKH